VGLGWLADEWTNFHISPFARFGPAEHGHRPPSNSRSERDSDLYFNDHWSGSCCTTPPSKTSQGSHREGSTTHG